MNVPDRPTRTFLSRKFDRDFGTLERSLVVGCFAILSFLSFFFFSFDEEQEEEKRDSR